MAPIVVAEYFTLSFLTVAERLNSRAFVGVDTVLIGLSHPPTRGGMLRIVVNLKRTWLSTDLSEKNFRRHSGSPRLVRVVRCGESNSMRSEQDSDQLQPATRSGCEETPLHSAFISDSGVAEKGLAGDGAIPAPGPAGRGVRQTDSSSRGRESGKVACSHEVTVTACTEARPRQAPRVEAFPTLRGMTCSSPRSCPAGTRRMRGWSAHRARPAGESGVQALGVLLTRADMRRARRCRTDETGWIRAAFR